MAKTRPHSGTELLNALLECEARVWQALQTSDSAADAALLSADFLGVYPDGFAGREDHVAQISAGASIDRYEVSEAKVRALGPDHGLLSYRALYSRCGKEVEEVMYVSSIWQRTDAGWVNTFSQDTPALDPERETN